MLPRRFIFLETFPMTLNGKADRRVLAERLGGGSPLLQRHDAQCERGGQKEGVNVSGEVICFHGLFLAVVSLLFY